MYRQTNCESATSFSHEHRIIEEIFRVIDVDGDGDDEKIGQAVHQLLDQGIGENPSYPGYYILKGIYLQEWGDVEEAIANFSQAIEIDPNFSDSYFAAGDSLYWRAQAHLRGIGLDGNVAFHFKNAYVDLKAAKALGNERAQVAFDQLFLEEDKAIFGETVIEQPLVEESENPFAQAFELFTKSEQAVMAGALWSNPELVQQNYQAISYLKKALGQDPSNPGHYILLGKLYKAIFQTEEAIEAFSKSIQLNPAYCDSNFPLGEALFQRGMAYFNDFNKEKSRENFLAAIEQCGHERAKTMLEMTDFLREKPS